ncbi:hypothetical protein SAMN05216503_3244 [Polaribacter sp. KT25b]|uniref:hypothetical protein n=1 Tax=Polaribacter sp. KT25b TaxID=1855336 RepID=UPI00087B44CB|nr:hypothetical protein [Polaribacter sp. KT25b]SDS49584.1 hypothetical protein SAMN05216503_3244 [Polaribacter sp. KT25b]
MELTKTQIQQVESYLKNKRFDFIDLKVEVLDHMISDIESLISKNISFENALKMTILKWNTHFRETSSFFFGLMYSDSKIVVKKAVKIFKPFYFLYLASYILPVIILMNFSFVFSETSINIINGFLNGFTITFLCYLIFIIVKVITSKVKTTYRFILKTQYLGIIFLIIPLLTGNHFDDDKKLNPVFTGFLLAGFAVTYICHYFYKKHEEAIKKYKIS